MANLTVPNPAQKAIEPISWLIGKWKSTKANGKYPGISSFEYTDEIEFTFFGQPLLSYTSKTWFINNDTHTRSPKHHESGFLKIKPNTNELCFLLAHNFGVNSLEEGKVQGHEIELKSTEISRMSFAKEPAVIDIQRSYRLIDNDTLEMDLSMATNQKQLAKHLHVIYKREAC